MCPGVQDFGSLRDMRINAIREIYAHCIPGYLNRVSPWCIVPDITLYASGLCVNFTESCSL